MASSSTDRRLGLTGGSAFKAPCAVATTAAITLSGEQTIDGVLTAASRVLVKNQTSSSANGIYTSDSGAWVRTLDADGSSDLVNGSLVYVNSGTVNGGTVWALSATDPVIVGTSALTYSTGLFSSSTNATFLQAGAGAVARTVQAKEREIVSITDFAANGVSGAAVDPTGVLDSTLGIQKAFAAAAGVAELFIESGTYLVSDTVLTLTQSTFRARIRGVPNQSILLNKASAGKPTISIKGGWHWDIRGLVLAGAAGFPNIGIEMTNNVGLNRNVFWHLEDIVCVTNGIGIHIQAANQGRIERYKYWPSGDNFGATVDALKRTNAILADGGVGDVVDDIVIADGTFLYVETIANGGVSIKWNCTEIANAIVIQNCEMELSAAATQRALSLKGVYHFQIIGNYCDNATWTFLDCRYGTITSNQANGTAVFVFGDGTAGGGCQHNYVAQMRVKSLTDDANCPNQTYDNITTVDAWAAGLGAYAVELNCSSDVTGQQGAFSADGINALTPSGNFHAIASKDYNNLANNASAVATISFGSAYTVSIIEVEFVGLNTAGATPCFVFGKHIIRVFNSAIATDNNPFADTLSGGTLVFTSAGNTVIVTVKNTSGNTIGAGFTVKVSCGANAALSGARGVSPITFT